MLFREIIVLRRSDIRRMKVLSLLAFAIIASANAGEDIVPEHDYMYFPDDAGNPHLIDLTEKGEDLTGYTTKDPILARNLDTILFQLYTINNPTSPQSLVLNSISSLESSNFRSNRPTRFVTHGWRNSGRSQAVVVIRDAYLAAGDYNVIVIDWSSFSNTIYVSAAPSVTGVAARVAEMINFLNKNAALDLSRTKLIGHSLGAHVSGIAARLAIGNIEAVVGLDPALPLFEFARPGQRVDKTDADHVQIIHTNGKLLGIMDPIGDSDFYPNGGRRQPGCGIDALGFCAHMRAYYFFAESILNPNGFPATGQRSNKIGAPNGLGQIFMGGRNLSTNASGSFTLATAGTSPYALG